MINKTVHILTLVFATLVLGGCANYSVTEREMTDYLQENIELEQSLGVENIMFAQIAVDDLEVKIGRTDADRVSVFANTSALIQVFNQKDMELDLDIEFSAIPEYDRETGEVFLKSLKLEKFDEKGQNLTSELEQFLKPAVSMIGQALSMSPVYKLDSNSIEQALVKSAEPNLVIRDNALVIELFE